MKILNAEEVIKLLELEPLEFEGGYYRRTYLSQTMVANELTLDRQRNLSSTIFYLLTAETYSRIHRLPADEVFHFYLGDPVEMFWMEQQGEVKTYILGSQITVGQLPQLVVPAYTWQASRMIEGGSYALMGTTMAPAFLESDFQRPEDRVAFIGEYAAHYHQLIQSLW